MTLALLAFALSFTAEFLGDVLAVRYQTAVRKLQRSPARRWAVLLALLGWVDLGGAVSGLPLWALLAGSLAGSYLGTDWAVKRQQVKERLRRQRRKDRDSPEPGP